MGTQFFVLESHPMDLAEKLKQLGANIYRDGGKLGFKFSLQCARALHFLHVHFVMHRDMKPENILISEDDDVILTDFGEAVKTDSNYLLDRKNLRAGNAAFCSPEVSMQIASNQRIIDFKKQASWELGMLMFEILKGEEPFDGYPAGCYRGENIFVPKLVAQDLNLEDVGVPHGVSEIIVELLACDPQARMPIAEALQK